MRSAKFHLYDLNASVTNPKALEIADPPVVIVTRSGAKVMAWLPVEDEDRWE